MADYCVVRTDKMTGTDDRAHVISAKYYTNGEEAPIENGSIVAIGRLDFKSTDGAELEREIFKVGPPIISGHAAMGPDGQTTATPKEEATELEIIPFDFLCLVASPEVFYDEHKKDLKLFRNEAGDILRCYKLHSGDIFSVTAEGFVGNPNVAVGDAVMTDASGKLKIIDTGATGLVIGNCIGIEKAGSYTFITIMVADAANE